ncbi:MAG: hypothetical protein O7F15_02520, partial [Gammaproteobacteria bacterium]|nr:hypothetical protein [Gammaproteobacteria bacterium]
VDLLFIAQLKTKKYSNSNIIMNRLNYNHLYYFYIVATDGSIARASTRVRICSSRRDAILGLIARHVPCYSHALISFIRERRL